MQNLALLASFQAKLEQSTEEEEPEEEVKQENQDEKEGEDDAGWWAKICMFAAI